jgi:hypothetical protein
LGCGVIVRISLEYFAVEETVAEVLVRLVVGDSSFLPDLAIGWRLVLALSHCEVLRFISQLQNMEASCCVGAFKALVDDKFGRDKLRASPMDPLSHHNRSTQPLQQQHREEHCSPWMHNLECYLKSIGKANIYRAMI